jgi:hypothetical protein
LVEDDRSGITYQRKLRAVITNETGGQIDISAPSWNARVGGVKEQQEPWSRIQLENGRGWRTAGFSGETEGPLSVRNGQTVMASIGLEHSIANESFRRLHEKRELGTLLLPVVIQAHKFSFALAL